MKSAWKSDDFLVWFTLGFTVNVWEVNIIFTSTKESLAGFMGLSMEKNGLEIV